MRSVFALLALAASAAAYQVTQPTNATGWTTAGSNVVAWDKVSTDQANFTIVLVNQVRPTSSPLWLRRVSNWLAPLERLPHDDSGPRCPR